MQTKKCSYCGVIQDYSTYKCLNCGGLVKPPAPSKLKQANKKIMFIFLLFIILVIIPIIYKKHINNTSAAIFNKLQSTTIDSHSKISPSTVSHFKIKAKFAHVLAEIAPIKMLVTEHYHMVGRFPASLSELGFNEKSFDTGEFIQAIQFSEKGLIQIFLTPDDFGNHKTITLTPRITMGGMNIQWTCTSNLDGYLTANICKPAV